MMEETIWKQMYLCLAGAMAEAEELYLSAGEEPECPQT